MIDINNCSYLLFYMEDGNKANKYSWIDQWCGKFELYPIIIDRGGPTPKSIPHFKTIKEAMEDKRFAKLDWVWLHAGGDQYLDEYEHKQNGIVYCIGSDYDGFDGMTADECKALGTAVKVRQLPEYEGEWFASLIVPIVMYDRFLYLSGRRK